MNRRQFIGTAGGAMLLGAVPANAYAGTYTESHTGAHAGVYARRANDRIRVAVIGIRGQGQDHIRQYQSLPDVEVAALCDVDSNLFAPVIKKYFTDKGLREPKTYIDMRKLFEDKTIDAVSVVTPNHWHALASIWAVQAGKHVSVEKPCCHNI
ncbi:MAG: Gfo/Idh/MocA family oxidoreductase, partial [Tannerella sp.]|nr:Gfo/Idh/MocA family oxidoreductase [Tannerella sp.]